MQGIPFCKTRRVTGQVLIGLASRLFESAEDFRCKGIALCLLAACELDDIGSVLPVLETAAEKTRLLHLVGSDKPNARWFVAETLRPVKENRWFYSEPEYPLSIHRHLFREESAYPRSAVGNNLSDPSRRLSDLVLGLVREFIETGDKNSPWIATRTCRTLA